MLRLAQCGIRLRGKMSGSDDGIPGSIAWPVTILRKVTKHLSSTMPPTFSQVAKRLTDAAPEQY